MEQDLQTPTLLSHLVKRFLLALYAWKGWSFAGTAPQSPKCVILGAPHTSNWDFVFFLGAVTTIGVRPSFVGKLSLFRAPLTRFMYDMGGIPVDRRARNQNYVEQVVDAFAKAETLALVIAPEGTRGPIKSWRSGFYHIALRAGVPIVPAWVNNASMKGGIGPEIMPSGDYAADLKKIAQFYYQHMPDHPKLAVLYREAGILEGASDA